ncbi:hypothetical protein I3760_09G213900 [Carya illinoinensis]|nr:hypothetical protein I3760_09G213900 [Carya illinoinensis]
MFAVLWLAIKKQGKATVLAPLPPGPRGLPIVGYLPFVGTKLHTKFEQLCGIYGPIYKVWLANKLCIVISSPSLAKEVVCDHDAIFSNRHANIVAHTVTFGASNIAFSPNEVRNTIRHLYDKNSTPIDLGDLAFLTVMNAIMNMLWGGTLCGEEGAKFGVEFKHIFAESVMILGKPNVSDVFPALASFDLQWIKRKAKRIFETIDGVLEYAIEKKIKILLEQREEDDGAPSMNRTQIKAVVFHPEIMRKVTGELIEIVGLDNLVEESHLPKLHYLESVIKETFRLHPPGPFLLLRTPSESTIIGGYHVPKGSSIFLHTRAIQRDPKYWDNPLEFKPERFLNNASGRFHYSGNNFKSFPFEPGRRICAGLALGERTLKYILASFLHSYEWKLPQALEIEFSNTFGVITKKKNPTIAIPTRRLSKYELYTK